MPDLTALEIHALALAASIGLFALMWPISIARQDASVVDAVWGTGFAVIAVLVWLTSGASEDWRALCLVGLVTLWAARLATYMIGRKLREPEEDPRYTKLRRSWDPGFWWKSLFVVFLLQAALQWLIALPVQRALVNGPEPFGALAVIGVVIAVVGLLIETVADAQLDRFRRAHPRPALCRSGLWAWSRHPNYFGEILFWWGVFLIAVPAAELWTAVGPAVLTLLLRYVSGVPMLEQHLKETRPEFDAYLRDTPMLTPRPPQQRRAAMKPAPERS